MTDGLGCPRCTGVTLAPDRGVLHEAVCPSCQGRFLGHSAAEQVLFTELGLVRETLVELAAMFGGRSLTCPGCTRATKPVTVRGVPVDVCFSCGGLWCDRGELHRLSHGRHDEVEIEGLAPAEPAVVAAASPASGGDVRGLGRRMEHGGCAVYLESPLPPDREVVWRAVGPFAEYTAPDLPILVRRACGILVDGVSRADADRVARVLGEGGLRAVVDDARWVELPNRTASRRLLVEEHGATLYDVMNTAVAVRWQDIDALGAGIVPVATSSGGTATPPPGGILRSLNRSFVGRMSDAYAGVTPGATEQMRYDRLRGGQRENEAIVLDVFTRQMRFQVVQGSSVQPLGGPEPRVDRLLTATKQIAERAPTETRMPSVDRLAAGEALPVYMDVRSYEREMAWALWFYQGGRRHFE